MPSAQEQYDEAMFEFSLGQFAEAARRLEAILDQDPTQFDARLALGMTYARLGDLERAIAEGHKAEKLRPQDQHVHTNLSLFYVKAGDKARAEHHGLQARIASWRGNLAPPEPGRAHDSTLEQTPPAAPAASPPPQFPDMPWKRKSS